jgi:hypothetical protein
MVEALPRQTGKSTVADPASWITGVGGFNVQKSRGC